MPKKITIIGGGSSTFTPQLVQLFMDSELLRGSTITLMDVDPARLEVMDVLSRRWIARREADLKIESTTNQRESLVGADFVITAISVGGFDAWENDMEIPARYGVYMPIADSVGPGGIMRGLRHIPVLASVAKDLEQVSPEAWVFNYSNPLDANCMAMVRTSSIKTVGLCTCACNPRVARYIPHLAEGVMDVSPADLVLPAPAAGLNHCAAILQLRMKDGRDAFPLIGAKVADPVTKWALEMFNVLCYGGGHWAEFYPPLCHLAEPYKGRMQRLMMECGIPAHDMEDERARARQWESLVERSVRDEGEFVLDTLPKDEGVEVVSIIEALLTNRGAVHMANVPNQGAISNLPDDAIVEVSSSVGAYGIMPLHVGGLPEGLATILRPHIVVQELTVEAALKGDRKAVLLAFLADPMTSAALSTSQIEKLVDELLNVEAPHLPEFA
jgi:alpha-galactosidase